MENLAPPLILVWDVKNSLQCGNSVHAGIKNYLSRGNTKCKFFLKVKDWYENHRNGINSQDFLQFSSPQRTYLLQILDAGLKGAPVLDSIKFLEESLILSCEEEIQKHLSDLPIKLLFPLLGLIFPSFLILIVLPSLKLMEF